MAVAGRAGRLVAPLVLLLLLFGTRALVMALTPAVEARLGVGTAPMLVTAATASTWLVLAFLVVRILDAFVWPMPSRRPSRLVTDLVAALVWVAAILTVLGMVLPMPVVGIVTTSGVTVAVLGFALRDMLASLFAGIAVNVERPYHIGDWLEVTPGTVGRVIEVGWLTTRLVTIDGLGLVVPNAHFATRSFANFSRPEPAWRDQVPVTLDYDVSPQRAGRILAAAAAGVPAANAAGRAPDARITGMTEHGVVWQVRYWLDDYRRRGDIRHDVHVAVLHHLYQAGLAPAHGALDLLHGDRPRREAEHNVPFDVLLARGDLFDTLGADDLQALAAAATRRRVAAGATVVREGEAGSSLFVVVEGVLDVGLTGPGRRQRRIDTLEPGDMFGEYSLLTGAPRSASVTARTDSLLFEITKADLLPVLERCPELAQAMSRTLTARQSRRERLATADREPDPGLPVGAEHGLLDRIRGFFGMGTEPDGAARRGPGSAPETGPRWSR